MTRRRLAVLLAGAATYLWRRRVRGRQERWGGGPIVASGPGIEVEHVEGLEPLVLWIAFGDPPDRLVLTGHHDTNTAYDSYRRWREQLELAYRPIASPVTVEYRGPDGVDRLLTVA